MPTVTQTAASRTSKPVPCLMCGRPTPIVANGEDLPNMNLAVIGGRLVPYIGCGSCEAYGTKLSHDTPIDVRFAAWKRWARRRNAAGRRHPSRILAAAKVLLANAKELA